MGGEREKDNWRGGGQGLIKKRREGMVTGGRVEKGVWVVLEVVLSQILRITPLGSV